MKFHRTGSITPFIVFFRLDETADVLIVLALFHQAQDRTRFAPDDDTPSDVE